MSDNYTRREIITIVAVVLTVGAITALITIFVVKQFLIGESADPLVKAGGLSPTQKTIPRAQ